MQVCVSRFTVNNLSREEMFVAIGKFVNLSIAPNLRHYLKKIKISSSYEPAVGNCQT